MCIAFPKAADGSDAQESRWKSALLLLPRIMGLLWMLLKLLTTGAKNFMKDRRQEA
jgi:hypothetical protein